jgi:hypothetical protein
MSPVRVTYVLPLRCGLGPHDHGELAEYLKALSRDVEVIVADGSDDPGFRAHRRWFVEPIRHLAPHPGLAFLNGKVNGVTTGLREASNERVVIADDDVRYDLGSLGAVAGLLEEADLAVPRNAFEPRPWHARWDMARTLLNLAAGIDYPGTLGIRRSTFLAMGGYDGNVLFENLELMRTVRASGGRVATGGPIVRRLPPSTPAFFRQRVRQAYDDLAQPARLLAELSVGPLLAVALTRRAWIPVAGAAAAAMALAEVGRRRRGARSAYPVTSSLLAPGWILERATCAWIAVGLRVVRGGCRYRDARIRRAATPMRELRRRAATRGLSVPRRSGDRGRRAFHRRAA